MRGELTVSKIRISDYVTQIMDALLLPNAVFFFTPFRGGLLPSMPLNTAETSLFTIAAAGKAVISVDLDRMADVPVCDPEKHWEELSLVRSALTSGAPTTIKQ